MTGWLELARTLASVASRPSPVDPKRRNGLPIAAEKLTPVTDWRGTWPPLEAGLVQPETELDDVGDAVVACPGPPLVIAGLLVAARREELLFQMRLADHAEQNGIDRLRVFSSSPPEAG